MKDTYYFQHDYNPTDDPKMVCLLGKYGGLGYGLYWRIIEMLHQDKCHKLPFDDYTFESISIQLNVELQKVKDFINDVITKYKLLSSDNEYFWSERVLRNIKNREEQRKKKSDAGKLGMSRRWHNNVITKNNTDITNITKESKRKESKIKEIKESILVPNELSENKEDIASWLAYKKEKGQTYKPQGLKALWKRLIDIPPPRRKEAIEFSMASNYAGIFDKGVQNGTSKSSYAGSVRSEEGKYSNLKTI